jgi:hypothetical protein
VGFVSFVVPPSGQVLQCNSTIFRSGDISISINSVLSGKRVTDDGKNEQVAYQPSIVTVKIDPMCTTALPVGNHTIPLTIGLSLTLNTVTFWTDSQSVSFFNIVVLVLSLSRAIVSVFQIAFPYLQRRIVPCATIAVGAESDKGQPEFDESDTWAAVDGVLATSSIQMTARNSLFAPYASKPGLMDPKTALTQGVPNSSNPHDDRVAAVQGQPSEENAHPPVPSTIADSCRELQCDGQLTMPVQQQAWVMRVLAERDARFESALAERDARIRSLEEAHNAVLQTKP